MLCMVIARKSRAFSFPNRNVPHIPVDEEASDRICSQFQPATWPSWSSFPLQGVGSPLRSRRQNRYKSILCEEDIYLKELVRYIHLNPLRAKMVSNLDELGAYAYSGHSVLMGEQKRDFQDRDYILCLFGKRERDAKKKYLLFVSKGIEEGEKPELTGGGLIRSVGGWKRLKDLRESGQRVNSDERILGGSEFVERVLMQANEEWERKALIKKSGIDLDSLLEKVGDHFCVDVKELKSGSRSRDIANARSVLCCLGVRNLGLTCVTMAKALGVSPSAVSKSIARGRNILQAEDIEDKLMKSQ